jgi:DNA repair protein RadD
VNYLQAPAAGAASAAHADGDRHQASPRRNNGCSEWAPSSHARHSQILRPYQETAVDDIEAALDEGEKVLYVLPTGGGKTVVLAKIIERAVQAGKRVLILTHRREILKQTSLKMAVDHGLIQAGLNVDLTYPVQIASVQTLWARCMRTDKAPLPAAHVIIVDEAHHVAARTWHMILKAYPNARLLGTSATHVGRMGAGWAITLAK